MYSGAFALARMSHRPIRFVGIHGTHRLWHADEGIGMTVTDRAVAIRVYPHTSTFETSDDFINAFTAVIGHFGRTGEDLPQVAVDKWLGTNN